MITTITLNPALDKLMQIDALNIGETNRTEILSESAAGKGIDVAKVIRDFNREVNATGFLGGIVAPIFKQCFLIYKKKHCSKISKQCINRFIFIWLNMVN